VRRGKASADDYVAWRRIPLVHYPNCEACSGRSSTPVGAAFPASDRSRFVDQIDDDWLNLRSVHENLKDRVFEFALDRSRPPAGILLQEPPRTEVELGYTLAFPVIDLPPWPTLCLEREL
jgi:hypothetical protein